VKTLLFIGKMITGNMGAENLSGPVGIAKMSGEAFSAGFLPFLYLMAILSISLGVLNLLPIPVLDGGQLTMLAIEAIRGEPLPARVENFAYTLGALMVGFLLVFAVTNDIFRWVG
jgi:regulator of sigma E protease